MSLDSKIITVLANVCKISTFTRHSKPFFEAHKTPNATNTMVSAQPLRRKYNPYYICSVLGRPSRTVSDRKTLRACGDIARGPSGHPFHAACRRAKSYVCAASALPATEMYCDSLIRTHRSRETLRTQWFLRFRCDFTKRYTRTSFRSFCLAGCTRLDFSVRRTCVGVRSCDRAFLQLSFKLCAGSKNNRQTYAETPSWASTDTKCGQV